MNFSLRFLEKFLFKKIELWALGLVLLLSLVVMVLFGWAVRHAIYGNNRLGSLGVVALQIASIPENIDNILTKPHTVDPNLTAKQHAFPDISGWTLLPKTEIKPRGDLGLILLSRYDGDLKQWLVELIDLNQQRIVHIWYGKFFHPMLTRDGSLIGHLVKNLGHKTLPNEYILKRVDRCGETLWRIGPYGFGFHHSIEKDTENFLWVPSRIVPSSIPETNDSFQDHAITMVSLDGKVVFRRSVSQILMDNGYRHLIYGRDKLDLNPIHLNDIQPIIEDGPFWKRGDIFLSLRNQSMVILYRPTTNSIVWAQQGPWSHQHDINILNDHQISIFNNNMETSLLTDDHVVGYNEVMIYDFRTGKTKSPYRSALEINQVQTISGGRSDIYPNGDVYIEETDYGRVLRVGVDGKLVWQFINRAENGNIYHVLWSRVIQAEEKHEYLDFLKLDCES